MKSHPHLSRTLSHSRLQPILGPLLGISLLAAAAALAAPSESPSPYARWNNGPSADAEFFPIAVWLQSPRNAEAYRQAGINTYVALWSGPTDEQLATLKKAGMKVICHMNETARQHLDDPVIIGWMHGDEPDNAQPRRGGNGYGPPIPPGRIVEDYKKLKETDPSRPVLLNLGQGVAWDNWVGRGSRRNHPEDYPEYLKGGDIVSFDIYPVAHDNPEVAGKLWYVAHGVERLAGWGAGEKVVWNCIECTHIGNADHKATPEQVRSEVWMSIIHGSRGLIYFVHEWKPKFNEAALLSDPEMLSAVTKINRQIRQLAPVLNAPSVTDGAEVSVDDQSAPVDLLVKRHEGAVYIFAAEMRDAPATARFGIAGLSGKHAVSVLGEERSLTSEGGKFEDRFQPWAVHLYRVEPGK